ncbi:MAG: hypothetical protein JO317_04430, partial [Verrucomicrobiae bacterium]|nr:hypothetical protein [Verrucomicrobiae bacterium]
MRFWTTCRSTFWLALLVIIVAGLGAPTAFAENAKRDADIETLNHLKAQKDAGQTLGHPGLDKEFISDLNKVSNGQASETRNQRTRDENRKYIKAKIYSPPNFSPLSLTSLLAGFDGDHLTQSAGKVSSWTDRSGNGLDLVQATAGNRPAYLSNAVNGNPGVQGDGVDDNLVSSGMITLARPFTIWMLVQVNTYDSSHYAIAATSGAGGTTKLFIYAFDGPHLFFETTGNVDVTSVAAGSWHVIK